MSYLATYIGLIALRFSKVRGFYPLVFGALFLYSAFRFEVGCDWTGYLNQFQYLNLTPVLELWQQSEPLWSAIIILLNHFDLPYPWLNVIASAIFFLGVHSLARRQPNPLAFLVLLFPILIINMPMSGIRQGAAIGVICLAFNAFIDRRLIRFLLFVGLAAGLHSSAVIFLLLAPIVRGDYSRRRLWLAALLALPGAGLLMGTESAALATGRYVDTGIDAAGAAFRAGLLVVSGIYYFLFLNRSWSRTYPNDHKLVVVGALLMLALAPLTAVSTVIGDRLGYYLIPIQTITFTRAPFLPLQHNQRLFLLAPYLGLLMIFSIWITLSSHFQGCYLPYQTWLFGFPEIIQYDF